MVDALGNAGTTAGGFWQVRHEDAMAKQLHNARAAQSGLVAALLAVKGFTGPSYILEGPHGFYAATCPDADPAAVTADPGGPWKMYDTSFKPWAACRHAHAAIDATLELRGTVDAAQVASVRVRSYSDAVAFCDRPDPATVIDAKFSFQHTVAVVLIDGPPTLSSFDLAAIDRADVTALRARITVEVAEPYDSAFPQHYGAEIEVTLNDGTKVDAVATDALGDPGNPVGDDTVVAKARELMDAGGVTPDRIDAIIAAALALAHGGTLDDLAALLP